MKFINGLVLLASLAAAAAVPAANGDMEKRECDHDAEAKCILACNTACVAAGPAGMGACIQGCSKSSQSQPALRV